MISRPPHGPAAAAPLRVGRAVVVTLLSLLAQPAAATQFGPPPPSPYALCETAIAAAAAGTRMPANLTLSIARAESGRADPATRRTRPWPWTINAGGVGSYYETKEEAVAAVQAFRARGMTSLDEGCMQVNLRHHPDAFASLEEAFDPAINARYAARFLIDLHRQLGDWTRATAAYHSQTPDLGEAYVRRVLGPGAVASLPAPQQPASPYAVWPPPGAVFAAFPPTTFAFGAFAPPIIAVPKPAPGARARRASDGRQTFILTPMPGVTRLPTPACSRGTAGAARAC